MNGTQTIQLDLYLPVIFEAVKTETHIKGRFDKATTGDEGAASAYTEDADEDFHDRKLMRAIQTALGELYGVLGDYLAQPMVSGADNISTSAYGDKVQILLQVGTRFNKAYLDPLAKMCSKYLEDKTLVLWWGTINTKQMEFYAALCASDVANIKKCFNKIPPPKAPVAITMNLQVTDSEMTVYVRDIAEIGYTIDAGAIDDIDVYVTDGHIAKPLHTPTGIAIMGLHAGVTTAHVFCRHNTSVYAVITVIVKDE